MSIRNRFTALALVVGLLCLGLAAPAFADSPPVVQLTVTPQSGDAPLAVTADASGSTDDIGIDHVKIWFGDGTAGYTASVATHTYPAAGSYTVGAYVWDTSGQYSVKRLPVTVTNPPPPSDCTGTDVNNGNADALVSAVNGGAAGSTVCVHAGTYDLGSRSLNPASNVSIIGDTGTVGPNGEISAPAIIKSSAQQIVTGSANNLTLKWLDISGASGSSGCKPSCGRGVSVGDNLTATFVRTHDNHTAGFGGNGDGMLLANDQIDHNGSEDMLGCCSGGVKSANNYEIRFSLIEANHGNGVWVDVSGNLYAHDNIITDNWYEGVRYECNSSCNQHAEIDNNVVKRNNAIVFAHPDTTDDNHWGIEVNSAPNGEVGFNTLGGTGRANGIKVGGGRGPVTGFNVHDNTMNGDRVICPSSGGTCVRNS